MEVLYISGGGVISVAQLFFVTKGVEDTSMV